MYRYLKLPLLIFAFLNLVAGMFTGLGRLGWSVPLADSYVHHGAIMVGGFLGSLIALEKVIPLKKKWLYTGPLLSAGSVLLFAVGMFQVSVVLLILASLMFMLVYFLYLQKQFSMYLVIAMIGTACWFIGNVLLWWQRFYPVAFPWWMAFLLFTIVSERLELSRFLPVSNRTKYMLLFFLALYVLGILLPFHGAGTYVAGVAVILISGWLLRYDVVRLTIKKEGLVRFTAVALSSGYIALFINGIFMITQRNMPMGYDTVVHTFFLGFVFAMIFAHGPIILPGVLGLSVKPYHPVFYIPLAGLLLSLGIRVLANTAAIPLYYRPLSGWVSMGSILLYFIFMLSFTIVALRRNDHH